ncbi:Dual specificity protein phosphatase [Tetrabaena socialis]|uniref:Dual specificity protein phosphatase n=1 Tax=Tetrabaena socialis TaxID=47790 RepID=A0A2J8AKB7_9CHLO|nr:Dual specificity protein phosphatase [Tetrabaena socialis]|eukprot:PNH12961.1 Dual specificity protein phosphatase [Tetrabaena socialis]
MSDKEPPDRSFWQAKRAIARNFATRRPPVNIDSRDTLCLIAPRLYLSSCHLEAQKQTLKSNGISHVLQVGKELSPSHPTSFVYMHIEAGRFGRKPRTLPFAVGPLVHFRVGARPSRSATVCIGYLMARGGLSLDDARASVHASRPAINPNPGFLLQLQRFQEAGCSAEGWQPWGLDTFLQVRGITGGPGPKRGVS